MAMGRSKRSAVAFSLLPSIDWGLHDTIPLKGAASGFLVANIVLFFFPFFLEHCKGRVLFVPLAVLVRHDGEYDGKIALPFFFFPASKC